MSQTASTLADKASGVLSADVPHLAEYFGVWAIQEEPFRAAVQRVSNLDLAAHVESRSAQGSESALAAGFETAPGGVAILNVRGPLMKQVSSLSGGTSTVKLRRQLRAAVADEMVRSIVLRIDSPGGTVAGTRDLAVDIAAAGKQKPVTAYIEDLGASAAYWLASQAKKVYANATALVGSIGTYGVIYDFSAQAAMIGVKVHVLRAGQFKGSGVAGTEVSAEVLADYQRIVDELNDHFVRGVAAGRRMNLAQVRQLADGRVHLAEGATGLGLIDGVQSFEETILQLTTSTTRNRKMTQELNQDTIGQAVTLKPVAATVAEIKSLCPGASGDFILAQVEGQSTIEQVQRAWQIDLAAQMKAKDEELAKAKAENEKLKAAKGKQEAPGVEPAAERRGTAKGDGGYSGDAVADFHEAVRERVKTGMSRRRAAIAVARGNPEMHEAFLRATNASTSRVQALIGERFEQ